MSRLLSMGLALFGLAVACGSTAQSTSSSTDAATGGARTGAGGAPANVFVDQIRFAAGGPGCLPRSLAVRADGTIACSLMEATRGTCTCDAAQGLASADPSLASATRKYLGSSGNCGGASGVDCTDYCVCQLIQLTGSALTQCQNNTDSSKIAPGFCYVDPFGDAGSPALVADCPSTEQRELRFTGGVAPNPDSLLFIACAT